MSGIYIPGMEMPTEGMVIAIYKLNGKFYASVHGTELCPLVHVPKHGDLIDMDALITKFCEWGTCLERGRKLVITMCEAKQAIVDIIEDAPTIIPADKEGEG